MKQNLPYSNGGELASRLAWSKIFSHLPKKAIGAKPIANGELMKLGDAGFGGHSLDVEIIDGEGEPLGRYDSGKKAKADPRQLFTGNLQLELGT
jgi:hypothetical protein